MSVSIDNFRSVESTFPHAVTLVRSMRGRNVFFFGDPVLVVGDGARDWEGQFPMVANIRLLELLDYYESMGMERSRIKRCRGLLLKSSVPSMLLLSVTRNGSGPNQVDYRRAISKFLGYREFWLSFFCVPFWRLRSLVREKPQTIGVMRLGDLFKIY